MEEQVSHVLYISTNCRVCHALRAKGIPRGVRVENVVDIMPRPAWLDGTPTLVDVNVGVLYKGSDSLIVLDHMRQSQAAMPPPPPQAPPQPRQAPNQPRQPPQQPEPPTRQTALKPANEVNGKANSGSKLDWDALFKPPLDLPPEDKPGGGAVQDSIADLISRRALQTPQPPQPPNAR